MLYLPPSDAAPKPARWRRLLQFRLSTLFLVVTLCAVLLGWCADHYGYNGRDLVGKWHFPHSGLKYAHFGYGTTLQIHRDGTFEKKQSDRTKTDTFSGTYRCERDGTVVFHVTRKTTHSDIIKLLNKAAQQMNSEAPQTPYPEVTSCNDTYDMRCAVDKQGFLIVDSVSLHVTTCGMQWDGTYEPAH